MPGITAVRQGRAFTAYTRMTIPVNRERWIAGLTTNKFWILLGRRVSVDRRGIDITVYEGPFTETPAGLSLPIMNLNRAMADTLSTVTLLDHVSPLLGGTELSRCLMPGGTHIGYRVNTETLTSTPWLYDKQSVYALRIRNLREFGTPTIVHIAWIWEERN